MKPWEFARLTIPEICMALDDDLEKVRPPHGAQAMSPLEVQAHVERLRAMTPLERLRAARDGGM